MSSGVKLSDEAYNTFQTMKKGKKHRYMLLEIEDGFIVVKKLVEKQADQREDFNALVGSLPSNLCCYVVLDMMVSGKDGASDNDALFFITWCPDSGRIKDKMLYASSKSAMLDKINEGVKPIQANDVSDIVYEDMMSHK